MRSALRDLRTRMITSTFVREERAAAMVEFSVAAMLIVVVVFGTVDWARFFFLRGQLAEAVRDSARYAATLTEAAADTVDVGAYARDLIGNTSASPTSGTVTVSFLGTAGTDRRVRVALTNFPFSRISPLVMKSAKTISVAAEFRREQP